MSCARWQRDHSRLQVSGQQSRPSRLHARQSRPSRLHVSEQGRTKVAGRQHGRAGSTAYDMNTGPAYPQSPATFSACFWVNVSSGAHLVPLDVRLSVVLKVIKALEAVLAQLAQLVCKSDESAGRTAACYGRHRSLPFHTTRADCSNGTSCHDHRVAAPPIHAADSPANWSGRRRSPTRTPLRVALLE